ncbi:hypothetical protein DFH09DRAFT_1328329 [Mycena vulgaris]|nr:hypothetical protein DFH09DRAFT_1328329 [Mycena vulgaris]
MTSRRLTQCTTTGLDPSALPTPPLFSPAGAGATTSTSPWNGQADAKGLINFDREGEGGAPASASKRLPARWGARPRPHRQGGISTSGRGISSRDRATKPKWCVFSFFAAFGADDDLCLYPKRLSAAGRHGDRDGDLFPFYFLSTRMYYSVLSIHGIILGMRRSCARCPSGDGQKRKRASVPLDVHTTRVGTASGSFLLLSSQPSSSHFTTERICDYG